MDSLERMGRRKFVGMMVEDDVQAACTGLQDELDVGSARECMQYKGIEDSFPAYLGGAPPPRPPAPPSSVTDARLQAGTTDGGCCSPRCSTASFTTLSSIWEAPTPAIGSR